MHLIEGKLEAELLRITLERSPYEAVGMIMGDGEIIELHNYAGDPRRQFEVHREDILDIDPMKFVVNPGDITLWHSHPNGGVGPSRTDMQQKTGCPNHLVVALIENTIIPSWY